MLILWRRRLGYRSTQTSGRAAQSYVYKRRTHRNAQLAAQVPARPLDFDLRVAFAAERRLLPALLLIGLVAAFAAMRAGANALALAWLALYGVNAAIRFLIATEYATASREVSAETRGGKIYLATAVADVVLWTLMLALVPNAAAFVAGPGAYAAAGAVLLGALSYGGWPRVWTFYVLAWVGVFAIGALRAPG